MDDIVTRLRKMNCYVNGVAVCINEQAADEIEQLRADRDRWRNLARDFADAGTHETAHTYVMDDYLALEEARRG